MALVDYRLEVYVRLWDLILASATNAAAFKPQNRVRFDTAKGARKIIAEKNLPADLPNIGIYYGNGSDEGWSSRYGGAYDTGVTVAASQAYTIRLTFDKPEIITASPLIAEVRAAILRGGPRLGGAAAGFGYVQRSGAATTTHQIGPDELTGGTNRLVSTFDVNVDMVLTIGQLCGT